jgi:hypothetical protein
LITLSLRCIESIDSITSGFVLIAPTVFVVVQFGIFQHPHHTLSAQLIRA